MATISEEALRQGRILMVDDDVSGLCLLENVLNRIGFARLRKLTFSARILTEFDALQPDLVITDIDMPEVDGIELIERLRAHLPRESCLPILVLTGVSDAQTKRRALLADAVRRVDPEKPVILMTGFALEPEQQPASVDVMLKKPLVRDELRRALREVLRTGRASDGRSAEVPQELTPEIAMALEAV